MNTKDIVSYIIMNNLSTDELNSLVRAINERHRINSAQSKAIAKATFTLGMKVSVGDIRPKYYIGVEGTIDSFNKTKTRVNLRITDPKGSDKIIETLITGIPIQCLEVLESANAANFTDEDANALVVWAGNK